MKPIYLQENFHYTREMLFHIMSGHDNPSSSDIDFCLKILNKLKDRNIVQPTQKHKERSSITADYNPEDEYQLSEIKNDGKDYELMFIYVGVIYIAGKILFICPKYLNHSYVVSNDKETDTDNNDPLLGPDSFYTEDSLFQKMKVINKVILKRQKKYNDTQNLDISQRSPNENTKLMLLIYFLNDYFENGLYFKRKEIRTINGNGEIDWDRTVNNSFGLISNNKPYYRDIHTRKRVEDDFDYFKELHRCIITQCSKELEACNLLDFFDLTGEELSTKTIDDFDDSEDKEVIKNKLLMEMKVQYNTRNQNLLKAMYSYVDEAYFKLDSNNDFLYSGVNTFHSVWEDICAEVLGDKRKTKLKDLPYNHDKFNEEYTPYMKLEEVIPKIHWDFNFHNCPKSSQALGGLIPDIISTPNKDTFIIFDAKYYIPTLGEEKGTAKSVPGVGDVNKQYLYQLAYRNFIKNFEIKKVANCFILPLEDEELYTKDELRGLVTASLFNDFLDELVDIQVRFIQADQIYEHYLNGTKYNIDNLELFSELDD